MADFTYVPMETGRFGYTAFVIDAFAGLILGWECAMSKETDFIEAAIRQATDYRERKGQVPSPERFTIPMQGASIPVSISPKH